MGQQASLEITKAVEPRVRPKTAIVIGARGGLGYALLNKLVDDQSIDQVIAISRNTHIKSEDPNVRWLKSDATDASIQKVANRINEEGIDLVSVYVVVGTLHDSESGRMPEKRIEDLDRTSMEEVFRVNTYLPMLWIKALSAALNKQSKTRFVVFSARVGSIGDNELGGWYSYRASKAALNMMLKTLAIELKRRYPETKVISFHPGTTDTELSKPFQKAVPEGKLFRPEFVAARLVNIVDQAESDGSLSYLDWDNKPIPW